MSGKRRFYCQVPPSILAGSDQRLTGEVKGQSHLLETELTSAVNRKMDADQMEVIEKESSDISKET